MGFIDIWGGPASAALNTFLKPALQDYLEGIVVIEEIRLKDKRPELTVELVGLPGTKADIRINRLEISDDCEKVTVGAYESNLPFLKNALNKFAETTIELPDNAAVRKGLGLVKTIL
ncbi:MAG: hypothetical protein Q4F72_10165 [Desulfovibrionaceae bacterium]|nr:hypothetical protein [Desulfovibrionaceae bacterium]